MGAVILLATLTGCGSGSAADPPAAHHETFRAYGKIRIENWNVKVTDGNGDCHLRGFRHPTVVITDPAGKRVALAHMGTTGVAPVTKNSKYFVPGRCDISWNVDLTKRGGVFTASLDGHPDITESFNASNSDSVALRLGWKFRT